MLEPRRLLAAGGIDTNYGIGGVAQAIFGANDATAIVAAGRLGENAALFRFNPDGSLDTGFGNGGVAAASGFQHDGYGAVEQADGEYILAGSQGTPVHFATERFFGEAPPTASGIGDISVAENSAPTTIALADDFHGGSVPASQLAYSITADSNPALFSAARVDAQTGSLTLVYAPHQTGAAQLTVRATDPDGAYVVSSFSVTLGADEPYSPGSLDPTFGTNGVVATPVQGTFGTLSFAHVQADGKILAAGFIQPNSSSNGNYAVTRYNSDGSVDTSFATGGLASAAIDDQVWGDAIQTDGKILISGNGRFGDATIVRLNADGALDTSFGTNGVVSTPMTGAGSVAEESDGKIVIAGIDHGDFAVARYDPDGSLDATFGTGGIARTAIGVEYRARPVALGIQVDGKIVEGGWAWDGSKEDFGLVRYDTNGELDTSFGNSGIVMTSLSGGDDELNDLTIQSDGKILASGVSGYRGVLARYNTDGTLDTSFGNGGVSIVQAAGVFYQSVVEPNGYIVTAGNVGEWGFGVFRFLPNGSLDTSFNQTGYARASGLTGVAEAVAVAPDGDYVVTGTGNTVPNPVGTFSSGTFVLARFDGSFGPTTSGIANLAVAQNSPPTVIELSNVFKDSNVPAEPLTYSIVADTNPSPFSSTTIDPQRGRLTLAYAPDDSGTAQLTVRATDSDGHYGEARFQVIVSYVNQAPSFIEGPNQTIDGSVLAQTVPGWATHISPGAGNDETGQTLSFIVTTDNDALFAVAPAIDSATGTLSYTLASHASGVAHVSVSLKDNGSTANGGVDTSPTQTFTIRVETTTPHQQYVIAVYHDVLGRAPDPGGLAYWLQKLDGGMAASSVAQAVAHSDEYYANFVIKPDYIKLLGRGADDSGVAYWTGKMDAGLSDQQLEADLVSSEEFYTNAGGTDSAWIDTVYKLLLGRAADDAGESYWNGQLAAGQTLNQVAQRIALSTENNTQLINDDYFHYLGRAADAGGLSYWLNQFAAGKTNEDVAAGFTGSAEYYQEHTD